MFAKILEEMSLLNNAGFIDKKIAIRLRDDGIYFSEKILGIKLHFYQKEVMNEEHRFISMCWSRQLGKTTLLAIKATHYAVTNSNKLIMILSQDRERAREFYNLIISYITSSPLLANMIVGDAKQSETKLDNGTRLINKAAGRDGRSLRGYAVDLLIIDEADFIPEPVFIAGEQCTSARRGRIWLISTPFRKATTFYKYFTEGLEARRKYDNPELLEEGEAPYDQPIGRKFGFKSYHHDWTAGLKARTTNGLTQLDEEFIVKKKRSMPKWAFEQEYMARWSDDIASYFNERQIRLCINKDYKEENYVYERQYPKQQVFVGIDFAKHKDRTVVYCIGKQVNGEYKTLFTWEMEGRDWNVQLTEINLMMLHLQPNYIFIDKTGLGDVMFDLMSKADIMPNGDKNHMLGYVVDITMTLQKKVSIYAHLQYMIGNQMIELPNHERLIREMIFLQYEKTHQSEWVRILAPESGDDIFDDYPDALALACQGTVDDVLFIPVTMQSIRKLQATPMHRKSPLRRKSEDEDLDAWELMMVQHKGAKVTNIMGSLSERSVGRIGGRGGYKRRNV